MFLFLNKQLLRLDSTLWDSYRVNDSTSADTLIVNGFILFLNKQLLKLDFTLWDSYIVNDSTSADTLIVNDFIY